MTGGPWHALFGGVQHAVLLAQTPPGAGSLTADLAPDPLWVHALRVGAAFGFLLVSTALVIWAERRTLARMQTRLGPNRAGPGGVLQSLADGVKLFFKEDIQPRAVDVPVYTVAPLIAPVTAFLAFAVVPFGGTVELFGERFALHVFDPDVGILWFLAMGSIHVYGVVLAGWASGSAYPLLGGVRSAAQMVSYELALGLAVGSVFIYTGDLRVSSIVAAQAGPGLTAGVPNWFVVPLFPAFVIFVVALIAETARPPFDLPEAEGELVGGFHTEYSGIRFALFFLGEFMNVITASAIIVTLFFGGPSGPVLTATAGWIWPVAWFLLKTAAFVFFFVLLRATLPRMRYDRLMDLGWNVMLPVGLGFVLLTGFLVVGSERLGTQARVAVSLSGIAALVLLYLLGPVLSRGLGRALRRPQGAGRAFPRVDDRNTDVKTDVKTERVGS